VLPERISQVHKHAHAPHPLALLCVCRKRQKNRGATSRAAEHLVGTSAMLNSVDGWVLFWNPKEQAPAPRGFEVTRTFSRSYNIKPQ
jgi:hypothetical protein